MTPQELETQLRATALSTPDPSWKEEILGLCESPPIQPAPSTFQNILAKPTTKLIALALLGWGAYAVAIHFTKRDHASSPALPDRALNSASRPPLLELSRTPTSAFDWDKALLKESDDFPDDPDAPFEDVEPSLTKFAPTLARFSAAIKSRQPLPRNPLPIARLRATAKAICIRAWRMLPEGDVERAFHDCLTLFRLTESLQTTGTVKANLTATSVAGMVIFPAGHGIEHGWEEDHLKTLQQKLLHPRLVGRCLATLAKSADEFSEARLLPYVNAWDERTNAFAEGIPTIPEQTGAELERHPNLVPDTCIVDCRMRQIGLFMALERHRRHHGEVPETLGELVPEICPKLPLDPGTGVSFRYKKLAPDNAELDCWDGSTMNLRHSQ